MLTADAAREALNPVGNAARPVPRAPHSETAFDLVFGEGSEYSDAAFIDFSDIRPVRPQQVRLGNRIASINREAQDDIFDRYSRSVGRVWGYAAGEKIEPLAKNETGKFRCARCNLYEITVREKTLPVGSEAPECDNCKRIGKAAQWCPLARHKKS